MELRVEIEAVRLLEQVLDLPPAERATWLQGKPITDAVRERVLELLAAEDEAGGFMQAPAPFDATDLEPVLPGAGDRLGPWQLVRILDAGGMGVVYLARRADDSYEQMAALKLVRTEHLLLDRHRRAELIARFENERRLLARLDHRHIARILDGGSTPSGVPYLVMEYIDGVSLTDYCDRHHLDIPARIALFCNVCDGVQAAHRHLIVHRDLKPQNILVGSDGEPRLLDFGIARVLEHDDVTATQTALAAMTPAYASPEQLRREPLTTASDVYSLGVVLYELLAGTRPHALEGLSPAQSERIVCDRTPEPLRKAMASGHLPEPERRARLARIGNDLERIVAKALHKDTDRRYHSAQALADDLRRHLDGRPVSAQPDTRWYRTRKFLGRHRLASSAAAAALAAIVASAAVAFWQAGQARRAVADTDRVNQYLIDVLSSSDPYTTGEEMTLTEALEEAAVHVDLKFASRPDLASGIRLAIGTSLANRYRFDGAETQLERGLAESLEAFGERDLRTLRLREAIALLHFYQGQTSTAIDQLETLIELMDGYGLSSDPFYVVTLNDLAYIHLNAEDYASALPYLRRAADAFERDGIDVPPDDRSTVLSNLAQAMDGLDRRQEAVEQYERALVIQRGLYPDGSANEAILLNNLALLHRNLGDRERSLELLQASARMRQRVLKTGHPLIVRGLTNVARQALELERYELGLEAAQEAVAVSDLAFTEPHAHQVFAVAALADAQWNNGDRDSAMANLERAGTLLAALAEPGENVVSYVQQLRTRFCDAAGGTAGCLR